MTVVKELASPVDPKTAMLTKRGLAKLPFDALPTTGYLARIIPDLDVDLEHFIGVWEGQTKIRGASGIVQDANLRIECGDYVSTRELRSTITVVTQMDKIRETWVLEEFEDKIALSQNLILPGSVFVRSVFQYGKLITSATEAKIRHPRVEFAFGKEKNNPSIAEIKKPSQLPLHTFNDIGILSSDYIPPQGDPISILQDLKDLFLRGHSGRAGSEIRSEVTRRIPAPFSMVGRMHSYQP